MELTEDFQGLSAFHGFDNYAKQPHNTCGQAVIASMLLFTRRATASASGATDELTELVLREHGPNWPFRNMMTNRRIMTRALRAYGIPFSEQVLNFGGKEEAAKERLVRAVAERKHPTIVLLDVHVLNLGRRFTLHWAVVYAVSRSSVRVSSWGRTFDIPWKDFLRAWRIWFLTYPYHYYLLEIEHESEPRP